MNNVIKVRIQSKSYSRNGSKVQVINDLNLDIHEYSFVSIIGPSGCGKSTLLKIILGLDTEYKGSIEYLNMKHKISFPDVSIVFQDLRLLPWLNVYDNVAFGLSKNIPKIFRNIKVNFILDLVNLTEYGNSWIKELSGGMKQKVALARAFVNVPKLVLLDEPFRELDEFTKNNLHEELKKIIVNQQVTSILVTHDIDEAIFLSDVIHVVSNKPSTLLKSFDLSAVDKTKNSDSFLQIRKEIYNELF